HAVALAEPNRGPSRPGGVNAPGALLLVLPAGAGCRVTARAPVAGVPVLRRIALAARRAGFSAVRVAEMAPADGPLLAGTPAAPLTSAAFPGAAPGGAPAAGPRRIVLGAANAVPQAAWLARLREMPVEPDHLLADDGAVAV